MAGDLPTYQASLLLPTFGDRMLPMQSNPGLVFERFLRIWKGLEQTSQGPGRLRPERLKDSALRDRLVTFASEYNASGAWLQPILSAHHQRLNRLEEREPHRLASELFRLTSRLAIGSGNVHPLENSLSFDALLGVPVVPGSAVKGLCRAQAEALGFTASGLETLFGDAGPEGLEESRLAGTLIFYDALPEQVPSLELEILNSHHPDYYSLGGRLEKPPLLPLDYERPIPVYFMSVEAGAVYRFRVGSRLRDQGLLKVGLELLRLALAELGLGSKTGSGAGRWETVNPRPVVGTTPPGQNASPSAAAVAKQDPVLRFEARIGTTVARMMRHEAEAALAPLSAGQDFHLSLLQEPNADDVDLYERTGVQRLKQWISSVHKTLATMEFRALHVFGIGPIPLLMVLGRELGDKLPMQLYQRHRDTNDWRWKEDGPEKLSIVWEAPPGNPREKHVAVLLNISGEIDRRSVRDAIKRHPTASREDPDLYVLRAAHPDVNILRRKEQTEEYRSALRSLITSIQKQHGTDVSVHLFPALPVPFAIETGRQLIQSDPVMYIYERRQGVDGFAYAFELTGKVPLDDEDEERNHMLKQLTGPQLATLRKVLKTVLTESREMRMYWKDCGLDETKIHWDLSAENVLQEILTEANKVPENLRKYIGMVREEFAGNDAVVSAIATAEAAQGAFTEAAAAPARAGDARAGDARAGDARAGDAPVGDSRAGDARGETQPKKTVLVLTASPQGEIPMTLGSELRDTQWILNSGTKSHLYRLEKLPAARKDELRDGLLRYRPAVLHLSGHGVGKEGLYLQDTEGEPELVSVQMLADQAKLSNKFLECVVLNACESLPVGEAMSKHIGVVIATRDNISDGAAVDFSRGFYLALFHGEHYESAFEHGVARVRETDAGEADKYVLLKR